MKTRLSVILPVYNAMPHLPEAIESILCQSFADFAFIIVNDGSTDGSEEYIRSLRDPRIVLINQMNQGQGAARNTALGLCQSEYAALMDGDDIALPDRFLLQLAYLDAHPDVVMLGTQFEFLIGNTHQKALLAPTRHEEIENKLLKGQAGLCNPSLMFRTASAIACGGYPSGVVGEDIDFCLRMCEQGRASNLDRILVRYRLHSSQTSLARSKDLISAARFASHRAILRRKGLPVPLFEKFRRDASMISRWRWSAEAWMLVQYRTGRIQMACGKPIRGFLRLALVGMCKPFSVIRRISPNAQTSHTAHSS
jgi:glycosyltransferase involved in cell wall biosynthesis